MAYELSRTSWGQEELDAMQRVLRSGRFTMGEQVRLFEDACAARFGMTHAVMVNSGSAANLVGVAALFDRANSPLHRGDEVIVPAISWATTLHPLQQYGLKLKFVDVELDTLNMDASQLEAALTPHTRMVVAVNLLGNPAPLDRIRAFCDAHDLIMFEDNCESMGASLDGKLCGTFGDINAFSTFHSHHISTMEGGLVVTNDTEIDHLARGIRNHGWARDVTGDNVRPLELAGAVGLEHIKKLDQVLAMRRKNAAYFVELFKDDPRVIIQRENGSSSWFSFTIVLNPTMNLDRARVTEALRNADIEFRTIAAGCLPADAAVASFEYDIVGSIANATTAHERGFFVGNHPRDITAEIDRLRSVLNAV